MAPCPPKEFEEGKAEGGQGKPRVRSTVLSEAEGGGGETEHLRADRMGVEVVFGELGREMEMEPVRDVLVSDRNRAKILR